MSITETILSYSNPEFRTFVANEVKASRGNVRSNFQELLDNEEVAERVWRALFEIKHELDVTRQNSNYVMMMVSRMATLDRLAALDDHKFQNVVDSEARHPNSAMRALLAEPQLIERWRLSLVYMKKNVESQMGSRADDIAGLEVHINAPDRNAEEVAAGLTGNQLRKARIEKWREARGKFVDWRSGAKRFKLSVEERIIDIQRIELSRRHETNGPVRRLLDAIDRHHSRAIQEFDEDEISAADRELWATAAQLKEIA